MCQLLLQGRPAKDQHSNNIAEALCSILLIQLIRPLLQINHRLFCHCLYLAWEKETMVVKYYFRGVAFFLALLIFSFRISVGKTSFPTFQGILSSCSVVVHTYHIKRVFPAVQCVVSREIMCQKKIVVQLQGVQHLILHIWRQT